MSKSTGKLKNIVFENYTNNAGKSIGLLETDSQGRILGLSRQTVKQIEKKYFYNLCVQYNTICTIQ